jgi:hypothetical protein
MNIIKKIKSLFKKKKVRQRRKTIQVENKYTTIVTELKSKKNKD